MEKVRRLSYTYRYIYNIWSTHDAGHLVSVPIPLNRLVVVSSLTVHISIYIHKCIYARVYH